METRQLGMNAEFKKAYEDKSLSFEQDQNNIWWFSETIHHHWGQRIQVDDFKLYKKTDFQTLMIFYNKRLGHVMVLDGAVQIAENDWRGYQEMLVGATILPQNPDPNETIEVLVIGGGDGGVATVALDLFPNANITMIEIDGEVVEAAKKYLPEISRSLTSHDPRFKLIIDDGIQFVESPENHKKFTSIIVDCTDPTEGSPATKLFGIGFQKNVKKCLKPNGIVLQQSGTLDMQEQEVQQTLEMMKGLYRYPMVLPVNMLTYPGTMTLVGGSDFDVRELGQKVLQKRFTEIYRLDKKTDYFNPEILLGALNHLPQKHQRWLESLLISADFSPRAFAKSPLSFIPPPVKQSSGDATSKPASTLGMK